jgi:hypothetical protein
MLTLPVAVGRAASSPPHRLQVPVARVTLPTDVPPQGQANVCGVELRGMTLHAVIVRRVTIHGPHPDWRCEVVRGIGYSWACRCKERGKIWRTHAEARADGRRHVAEATAGEVEVREPLSH